MNIVGLDLSITATGVSTEAETLTIKPKLKGDLRLVEIVDSVTSLIDEGDIVILEDYVTHSHAASILGMAHGAVRYGLMIMGVTYVTVPPATLKIYATGKGNAKKPDMRMELYRRTGVDLDDDNQVDATWLRLLGLDLAGKPPLHLPQSHRRALDKLHRIGEAA